MSIVVSDTSPVRALQHLSRLDLLEMLFGQVLIPPAVASELRQASGSVPAIEIAAYRQFVVRRPADQDPGPCAFRAP